LVAGPWELPFHFAHKAVAHHIPGQGAISPEKPNAYKFERFIFDIMPQATKALIVEADRKREFNPLKNAEGVHSPDDVRRSLMDLYRGWLRAADKATPDDVPVEISPLIALDAAEFAARADQVQPQQTDRGLLWTESS
jgi:UDP-N-acetylglucosamine/UDP-N-acetylgalactosamine diphosphorylase